DRVAATASIEGHEVLLVDTGGLDPDAEEGIPAAIRRQVAQVVADAAVILFVVDARAGLLPLDREIAQLLRVARGKVVLVANKSDSPALENQAQEFHALGFEELVTCCASHARGIPDVAVSIAERLPRRDPVTGEARPAGPPRLAIVGRPNVG